MWIAYIGKWQQSTKLHQKVTSSKTYDNQFCSIHCSSDVGFIVDFASCVRIFATWRKSRFHWDLLQTLQRSNDVMRIRVRSVATKYTVGIIGHWTNNLEIGSRQLTCTGLKTIDLISFTPKTNPCSQMATSRNTQRSHSCNSANEIKTKTIQTEIQKPVCIYNTAWLNLHYKTSLQIFTCTNLFTSYVLNTLWYKCERLTSPTTDLLINVNGTDHGMPLTMVCHRRVGHSKN